MGKFWVTLLLCLHAVVATAGGIYRYLDDDGNVVFSDQPHPGAEQVKVRPTNTLGVSPANYAAKPEADAGPKAPGYASVSILAPENDSAFWDATGVVPVTIQTLPDLAPGDLVQLLMDGQPVAEPTRITRFSVRDVDRGTHTLTVQVLNPNGEVVAESATTTFTRHQPSLLRPAPP